MRAMNSNSLLAYATTVEPNLTKREAWVLEALEEIAPASCEDVANHLGVFPHTISGRFTGLKNKGKIIFVKKDLNERRKRVDYWKPKVELEQMSLDCD